MSSLSRRTCSVEGCNQVHFGLGLCNRHYSRLKRRGYTVFTPKPLSGEEWAQIPEWGGRYWVSNCGRVHNGVKLLKPSLTPNGYYRVDLQFDTEVKRSSVHRLVAEAFIPNPENKPQVNHKDGVKANNCVENLEWVTAQENMRHMVDVIGRKRIQSNAKLTESDVLAIRAELESGLWTHSQLARRYGVSRKSISHILHRVTWSHI